ncbi:galactose-binding domain-like protein [Mucidula mucida]|nr:galactose-binding domain-like protein [Mucidula mucida]
MNAFLHTTELSSIAIGARVLAVSDDFFASAHNLILVEPAISLKGQFGPNGALYSGWESRRHNTAHDWCIIRLGTSGSLIGFDIDTSHFNGNEAPAVSVDAFLGPPDIQPAHDDPRWTELLAKMDCGPNAHHYVQIPDSAPVNYLKLNMYPDGGIARFRAYGHVIPVHPTDPFTLFDLAHVFAGGAVQATSDQHFGVGSNLILPGRGKDMGDGWETKRSRQKGHCDWALIKLGCPGYLQHVEIDTAHFKGNFPESCDIVATSDVDADEWTLILPRTKLGPHRQHYFQLDNVQGRAFTHIKITIYPDGGLKRVRVLGTQSPAPTSVLPTETSLVHTSTVISAHTPALSLPVLPLTPEAFAPFGQVVQAYADHAAAPKGTRITPANFGSAFKFHKLSLLESNYPDDSNASAGLSVYHCQPPSAFHLTAMERHAHTNQAFIPMGGNSRGYLVVVAQNGSDDKPDLSTLRAFKADVTQGVVYNRALWHQPMTVLDEMNFTCVETQIGDGSQADCEVIQLKDVFDLRM